MKKTLLLFFFIFIFWGLQAQTSYMYFGTGYNASFMKLKNYNYVIDRYNETRLWLDDKMENMHYIDGGAWASQFAINAFIFDMNYARRIDKSSARGISSNGDVQRDLEFRINTFGFGMGLNLSRGPAFFGMGMNCDVGYNKVNTRVAPPGDIKNTDYTEVNDNLTVGFTLWSQLMFTGKKDAGIGFVLKPYFYMSVVEEDYYDVNRAINSATYWQDPTDLYDKLNHFGIQAMLVFYIKD